MISVSINLHSDAASVIAADGINILIDLNGHTLNGGMPVLAHRPAPVQVHSSIYCHHVCYLTTIFISTLHNHSYDIIVAISYSKRNNESISTTQH